MAKSLMGGNTDISITDLDDILTTDRPKANIILHNAHFDIRIEISLEMMPESTAIMIYIDFYYGNRRTAYNEIDPAQIAILSGLYDEYVKDLVAKKLDYSTSLSSTLSLSYIANSVKNVVSRMRTIRPLVRRYENLKCVNIYSLSSALYLSRNNADNNGYYNTSVRTTIELDADILTIIPENLLLLPDINNFLRLHRTNVFLANHLFFYPIMRTFAVLKIISNIIRMLSVFIWIISTYLLSFILFPDQVYSDPEKLIYSIINFVGIPTVIFRFFPRVLGRIIGSKLSLI